jgi:acetyl esterase/lipase
MFAKSSACVLVMATAALSPAQLSGQLTEAGAWTAHLRTEYRLFTNIVYHRAGSFEAKLNVYRPRSAAEPNPTVVYYHGGGWLIGSPEHAILEVLPYLEMGWTVVTVGYRLTQVANAPAAVEDALCALRWVVQNAQQHFIDTTKIVVSGASAGGHLALAAGMIPPEVGLGNACLADRTFPIAAIINWFGITDVADLLDGANRQNYAVMWLGSAPDRQAIAIRASPLTYVRSGLPPILSIHGTADPAVPYSHSLRLHEELERRGVVNELVTVPNGGHGNFTPEQDRMIHTRIRAFLAARGLHPTIDAAPRSNQLF